MANSYLTRTNSSTGSTTLATISMWVKLSSISTDQALWEMYNDNSNYFRIRYASDSTIRLQADISNSTILDKRTTRKFKDVNGFYHIVVQINLADSTAEDKLKLYINGERETLFSTNTNTSATSANWVGGGNGFNVTIGRHPSDAAYLQGYISHYCFVDGTVVAPTVFGETESTSGIWKFKSPSGVTFGTNGFHLKFENSAAMGTDSSGNSNTYTVNGNLVQSVDTPSNVFCTMNPIVSNRSGFTFSNGNLTVNTPSTSGSAANMGVNQGKWYFECLINTLGNFYGGWQDLDNVASNTNSYMVDGCVATNNGPDIYYGTSSSSANSMNGMAQGDYIGFAIDVPNLKCWWSRNGQWYTADSATPTTLTRAQVSANNNGFDLTTGSEMNSSSTIAPYMGTSTAATNNSFNFGTGIFGTTKLTGTTYADDNGVGIFKYEPPAGFRAICTKNINTYG
tara:strand:- start:2072 stop:3430 length:1359 start_codon:yes stop_codon:yes gene_type:complete